MGAAAELLADEADETTGEGIADADEATTEDATGDPRADEVTGEVMTFDVATAEVEAFAEADPMTTDEALLAEALAEADALPPAPAELAFESYTLSLDEPPQNSPELPPQAELH